VAEHRLKALTALGRPEPLAGRIGPVALTERTDAALASAAARRGRDAEMGERAGGAGIPLPGPGRAEAGPLWGAFWVSPGMWFVEAPLATHEDIAAHLKAILGDSASVTEQTDAWVRLDVEGPLAPMFERLCNVDLARFPPGSATRTLLEHLGVYLVRRSDDRMSVLGPRSSAASLHHALAAAAGSAF
jgi:sarcosine oxidase subunit gamma